MFARVSVDELAEMWADYLIEPWGAYRGDLQSARICQTIAAANGEKHAHLDSYLLNFDAPREQSDAEQQALCRAISEAYAKKYEAENVDG